MKVTVKAGMEARFKLAINALDRDVNIISTSPPRSFTINTNIKKQDLETMTSVESVDVIAAGWSGPLCVGDVKEFVTNDPNYNGVETMILGGDGDTKDSYIVMKIDLNSNLLMIFAADAVIVTVSDFLTMVNGMDSLSLMMVDGIYSQPIRSIVRENNSYVLR